MSSEETLSRDLRIKASMINLGERIAWGSETALMDAAADRIDALEAENARLRQDNARLTETLERWLDLDKARSAERDAALAQLAAIQQAKGEGEKIDTPWPDFNLDGEPCYGEETVNKLVAQHQRITAAMAAEVERLKAEVARWHTLACNHSRAEDQLRAELAAVKGQE